MSIVGTAFAWNKPPPPFATACFLEMLLISVKRDLISVRRDLLRRVLSPNRYMAFARFCFCKNNKRMIIIISVKRDPISVKRDLISVRRDLISVKRDLISFKRDLICVKRDLITVQRDPISVKRDPIRVKRDPISVKRDPISVKRDLISVKRDLIISEKALRPRASGAGLLPACASGASLATS